MSWKRTTQQTRATLVTKGDGSHPSISETPVPPVCDNCRCCHRTRETLADAPLTDGMLSYPGSAGGESKTTRAHQKVGRQMARARLQFCHTGLCVVLLTVPFPLCFTSLSCVLSSLPRGV